MVRGYDTNFPYAMDWCSQIVPKQGNTPYLQDVKKEVTKTEVKKEEIVLTLKVGTNNQESAESKD